MPNDEIIDFFPFHTQNLCLQLPDVLETVQYWHHVLGFPNKWTWGEPPYHGGVTWQGSV